MSSSKVSMKHIYSPNNNIQSTSCEISTYPEFDCIENQGRKKMNI